MYISVHSSLVGQEVRALEVIKTDEGAVWCCGEFLTRGVPNWLQSSMGRREPRKGASTDVSSVAGSCMAGP